MPLLPVREGRRIHYEVEGQGPPLLLLHPAGVASTIWRDLGYVDRLRDSRRLILVDSLGYGLSSKPHTAEAYSWERQVADLVAVLEAAEAPRADVFGYSMGGVLAVVLAIMSPESVNRLAAAGAPPPGMQPVPSKDYVRSVPLDRGADVYARAAIQRWRSVGVELSEPSKSGLFAADLQAVAARRAAVGASDLSCHLSRIRAPTMLMAGSEDPFAEAVGAASKMIPGCVFVPLEGRSHIGAIAERDAIVRELQRFLAPGGSLGDVPRGPHPAPGFPPARE